MNNNISLMKFLVVVLFSSALSACGGGESEGSDPNAGSGGGVPVVSGTHRVLAFNDLGMHCADLDYSTFVILPPFNVVHSQVIERGAAPQLLDSSSVQVSYRAVSDAGGSVNTTSQNQGGAVHKSNFWDINPDSGHRYVFDLFGLNSPPDEGLAFGQKMPGILNPYAVNDPQPFNDFDTAMDWFTAAGVPILPVDDFGQLNAYPLMRVSATARGGGGTLASVDVVLPVASEADCQNCHALGEVAAAVSSPLDFIPPETITDPNSVLQAAKHNILVLHDDRHGTRLVSQTPVLCARCHYSAALDLTASGPAAMQLGHGTMSAVMHGHHGSLTDPGNGAALFPAGGSMEQTCYQCHPGKLTKCLRGAMGAAGVECSDCHGSMQAVGRSTRKPWVDEPRCESCHTGDAVSHSGSRIRQGTAYDNGIDSATPRVAANRRFAENNGKLYRNSLGHGGVACEGCHGSTHAIWPTAPASANDNLAAIQLQGHAGTLSECSSCHTSLSLTVDGPHGMHNVNSRGWNSGHESFYQRNPGLCRACHGQNLEGTELSRAAADRDLQRDDEGGTIHVAKGTEISCNLCHRQP